MCVKRGILVGNCIWEELYLGRDFLLLSRLKVHPQFDFFTSLILNSFCKKSNLPVIHGNMLARL